MSVLAVLGLWTVIGLAMQSHRLSILRVWMRRPALVGLVALILLVLITTRSRFDLGFVHEFRAYMATVPDGTRIFSHKSMREITHLVDSAAARRFDWYAPNAILHSQPEIEAEALKCAEFWYARKLVWLNTRKQLERKQIAVPQPLATYFEAPERDWRMSQLLAKGDTPDLIFYRRRTAETPAPLILEAPAAEWEAVTRLPASWTERDHDRTQVTTLDVPEKLRGKLARFEMIAASEHVEALTVRLRYTTGKTLHAEYLLKPYLHPQPTKEFFAMQIPVNAEQCEVQMKFSRSAERVDFTSFRAIVEDPVPLAPVQASR
jgi:hypothetical protein